MRIARTREKFVVALTTFGLLGVTGCDKTTPVGSETEYEICRAWQDSLPTRSRADTAQTKAEIGHGYDVFLAACPGGVLPS